LGFDGADVVCGVVGVGVGVDGVVMRVQRYGLWVLVCRTRAWHWAEPLSGSAALRLMVGAYWDLVLPGLTQRMNQSDWFYLV